MSVLIPRLVFLCTTPNFLHRGCFTMSLKESSSKCSQLVHAGFLVLTKEIHCPQAFRSQQTALLCPLVSSLCTAHIWFPGFLTTLLKLDPFQFVCISLHVSYLKMISRGRTKAAYPLDTPGSLSMQSQEKQLFLQLLHSLFSYHLVGQGWGLNYFTGRNNCILYVAVYIFLAIHLYDVLYEEPAQLNILVLPLIFSVNFTNLPSNWEI